LAPVTDIAIERPTASIAESDIAAMLESMRRQRPDFVAVERSAGDTDRVTVDFEGRIDGVTFQGGTGIDVPFVVGQGRMLKEFEDGVRGAKAGDSRTVTVNFPADYGSPRRSAAACARRCSMRSMRRTPSTCRSR
ncbi:MAG: hypothetical protein EBR15_02430, partial [Gammaproteobacteria bacterium]|nr:hypothetical protein [Gammaproteobacteria bacterium]